MIRVAVRENQDRNIKGDMDTIAPHLEGLKGALGSYARAVNRVTAGLLFLCRVRPETSMLFTA